MGSAGGGRQEANSVVLSLTPRANAASRCELFSAKFTLPICQARLLAFLFVMIFPLSASCRSNVEGILPILLYSGWEFLHVGEKRSDLPNILFGKDALP